MKNNHMVVDPTDIVQREKEIDQAEERRASKWNRRFMNLAEHVANWSRDPSTKCGAIIVAGGSNVVLSMGYNGFPRGVDDDPDRYEDRSKKYPRIVHAELNAILSLRVDDRVDVRLYTTKFPCTECIKAIIQTGIWRVYSPAPDVGGKWAEDSVIGQSMLEESGVTWEKLE